MSIEKAQKLVDDGKLDSVSKHWDGSNYTVTVAKGKNVGTGVDVDPDVAAETALSDLKS